MRKFAWLQFSFILGVTSFSFLKKKKYIADTLIKWEYRSILLSQRLIARRMIFKKNQDLLPKKQSIPDSFSFSHQRSCDISFAYSSVNARCTRFLCRLKRWAKSETLCLWQNVIKIYVVIPFIHEYDYKSLNLNL